MVKNGASIFGGGVNFYISYQTRILYHKKYSQTESNHRLSPHMHAIKIDIRAMLYQLSYASGVTVIRYRQTLCPHGDSNAGPSVYKTDALNQL